MSAGDADLPAMRVESLVEAGDPVWVEFRNTYRAAKRDMDSGYVFFDPPAPDELRDYYQRTYAHDHAAGYYTCEIDYEPGKNGYHANRILEVCRALNGRDPGTSLELGCAYGGLVAEMARRGVDARGADINDDAVAQGERLQGNTRIFAADNATAIRGLTRKVDLIYSLHVLEHDPDMLSVIASCGDALTDDGILFLSVPNAMYAGSVFGGFRKNMWAIYPQHLHMLSPGFVPRLCRAAGFTPLFWDTRIVFGVQPDAEALLGVGDPDPRRRGAWELILRQAGLGMELNVALTPARCRLSPRHAEAARIAAVTLEQARLHEVEVRTLLARVE